jgi:hypothetical protein
MNEFKTLAAIKRYILKFTNLIMKQQFEAVLTGTDTLVDGIANKINFSGYDNAWEFKSVDNNVHLIIAKDDDENWVRVAGSEPYLSSWVDELAEQTV